MIQLAKQPRLNPPPPSSLSVQHVWRWHLTTFRAPTTEPWVPAVNVYRLADRLEICADLAGMSPRDIELRVEPGRLTLSGHRQPPQPTIASGQTMQILAMEIDHGPFTRSIGIPRHVDLSSVETRYDHGILCVRLPLT